MARSIWKGPFVHPSLLKKVDKLKDKDIKLDVDKKSENIILNVLNVRKTVFKVN